MKHLITCYLFLFFTVFPQEVFPQGTAWTEKIPFGDMDTWAVRFIKESILLGGQTKQIYALGPLDTLYGNNAYDFDQTVWGVSNAYANVVGVVKAANTLYPELRTPGTRDYCARLESKMETVRVIGLIDLKVAISGSLFLGRVFEPVRSANDPYGCVSYGIPFSKSPKALVFDVKANVSPEQTLTKALGMGSSTIDGHDAPQVYVFLQKRREDENGNIIAQRVGTGFVRFETSFPWKNDYRLEIHYGDVTGLKGWETYNSWFPQYDVYRCVNSRGKLVEVLEQGYAAPGEAPTHVMVMFSSGHFPAFYTHQGNALWIDNVRWEY